MVDLTCARTAFGRKEFHPWPCGQGKMCELRVKDLGHRPELAVLLCKGVKVDQAAGGEPLGPYRVLTISTSCERCLRKTGDRANVASLQATPSR